MTPETFVRKLKQLGYTPHNAAEFFGIGRRSAYRHAMGETAIPQVIVKLLDGDHRQTTDSTTHFRVELGLK